MKPNLLILLFFFFAITSNVFGQNELDSLLQSMTETPKNNKVFATFKTTRIVNGHSIETVKAKSLDFRVTHHFGNVLGSTGGAHTIYGLDQASDIRIAFEYGISNKLTVGFGRSKINELLDLYGKYRLLEQTESNSMPLAITLILNTGFSPAKNTKNSYDNFANRFSYLYQALIARKFSKSFSLQLAPTFLHRNYVFNRLDENDQFALGLGLRLKLTKRFALLTDYFYTFSKYRKNNPSLYSLPLGLGVEIETGGHVFHIFFTNNAAITENNFIPYTTSFWEKGEFKFGFTISRVF